MATLDDLLRDASGTVEHTRATALAKNDYRLIAQLVSVRRLRGLSQSEVAARLGISQQAISKLESHDSDPRLSTIRRYANAVEALVAHAVEADRGQLLHSTIWVSATFTEVSKPTTNSYVATPAANYKRTDLAIAA